MLVDRHHATPHHLEKTDAGFSSGYAQIKDKNSPGKLHSSFCRFPSTIHPLNRQNKHMFALGFGSMLYRGNIFFSGSATMKPRSSRAEDNCWKKLDTTSTTARTSNDTTPSEEGRSHVLHSSRLEVVIFLTALALLFVQSNDNEMERRAERRGLQSV